MPWSTLGIGSAESSAETHTETYTETAREVREPGTQTTTIRTVTRTVTDPPRRAPRTRFFRRLSKYRGEKNLAAWEERTSKPMFVASLLYLLAFAAPIVSTRIREPYDAHLNFLQLILWALFAADYCIRLYLAPRRLYFITHNLMNLAIVLLPAWRIVSFLAMIHPDHQPPVQETLRAGNEALRVHRNLHYHVCPGDLFGGILRPGCYDS